MTKSRKLAAILVTDIVGYSRLAGADEDRILARLRTLRSDLIEPTISVHRGRVVKGTGDGFIVEFRSVVDAVRCAIELQHGLMERNAGLPPERRIEFRVGIHLGDVVEESDGDLMGDGVNIAARLEGIAKPGAICLSEDAYRQVKGRLDLMVSDLGQTELKNIAEPIRVYSLEVGGAAQVSPAPSPAPAEKPAPLRLSIVVLPFISLGVDVEHELFVDGVTESLTTDLSRINNATVVLAQHCLLRTRVSRSTPSRSAEISTCATSSREAFNAAAAECASMSSSSTRSPETTCGRTGSTSRWLTCSTCKMRLSPNSPINCARSCSPRKQGAPRLWRTRIPSISISRGFNSSTKAGSTTSRPLAAILSAPWRSIRRNIDALVGAARADVLVGAIYTTEHRAERLADAEALLIKGISIAPRNFWAHLWLGFVQIQTNRASRAIGELEQALSLNRNLGAAHAWIGQAKITMGRADEAEAHVNEAFRLSPNDAVAFIWTHIRGLAKLHLGADEEAAALFRRSVDASRNYPLSHFYMAAALAYLDRLDEARAEVKAGQALAPNYSIARFLTMAESDNPTYLKQRERIQDGLRKAGVAEK